MNTRSAPRSRSRPRAAAEAFKVLKLVSSEPSPRRRTAKEFLFWRRAASPIFMPFDPVQRTKGLLMNEESTLSGWWVFAGVLLLVAGILNIICGHRRDRRLEVLHRQRHLHHQRPPHLGLDHPDRRRARDDRGLLAVVAAGEFGRWFGIFIAALNAIGSLLSIGGLPVLVAGGLRALDHHHLQARRGARRHAA